MKALINKFSFPYKNLVLVISAILIFSPVILTMFIPLDDIIASPEMFRYLLMVFTFLATIGFIYSILGYHIVTLRGDELKLRIHLEALNIAFTVSLIALFVFIFIFLNFWPDMLNWLPVLIAVIGIITYVLSVELVKEKYR